MYVENDEQKKLEYYTQYLFQKKIDDNSQIRKKSKPMNVEDILGLVCKRQDNRQNENN